MSFRLDNTLCSVSKYDRRCDGATYVRKLRQLDIMEIIVGNRG